MLHNVNELHGLTIGASDGDIGEVKDVYFDDKCWVIRYLVTDTGGWLSGRKVLIISPFSVGKEARHVNVVAGASRRRLACPCRPLGNEVDAGGDEGEQHQRGIEPTEVQAARGQGLVEQIA